MARLNSCKPAGRGAGCRSGNHGRGRADGSCLLCVLEQSPRREHLVKDEGFERESVRLGEGCLPEEGKARRELCLPPVQLEGRRGGVLDRYAWPRRRPSLILSWADGFLLWRRNQWDVGIPETLSTGQTTNSRKQGPEVESRASVMPQASVGANKTKVLGVTSQGPHQQDQPASALSPELHGPGCVVPAPGKGTCADFRTHVTLVVAVA